MTAPTVTRAALRRSIGLQLSMPYFRLYASNLTSDAGSDTAKIISTSLTQPEHFWEGSWVFGPTSEAIRQIVSFESGANRLVPDRAFAATMASNEFEIHSGWNADQMHRAINRAIDKAFPAFYGVTADETIILQTEQLNYNLATGTNPTNGSDGYLSYNPYRIVSVEIERPYLTRTGQASAGAATTVTAPSTMDLSDVTANWYCSIYDGTGRGQLRKIISADNTTKVITISSGATDWTTNPDSTSWIRIWDSYDQYYRWSKLWAVDFDRKPWPTVMRLTRNYQASYGCRIRITYVHKPAALTTEAGTTVVPEEYIIPYALAILAGERISINKYDRDRYTRMRADMMAEAEEYKRNYYWPMPQGTPWQESDPNDYSGYYPNDHGDPLGWSQRV